MRIHGELHATNSRLSFETLVLKCYTLRIEPILIHHYVI